MYGRDLINEIKAGDFSGITLVEDTFIDVGEAFGVGKNVLRGLGHTTHQMEKAPQGATFVWCNNDAHYAKLLAGHLGRDDLIIKPSSWFHEGFLRFKFRGQIVVDHAYIDHNSSPERTHIHAICN